MRRLVLVVILAVLSIAFADHTHIAIPITSPNDLAIVGKLRLNIELRRNDTLILKVTENDLKALRDAGLKWTAYQYPSAAEVRSIIQEGTSRERAPSGSEYHNYEQLKTFMNEVAMRHPTFVRVSSIGKSVQDRELLVMRITDNPDIEEREPEIKYIGNIHGDETVGRENLIRFISYLTSQYGVDPRVTRLIDTTDIYILPSMNPDAFELGQRENVNEIDLNRDFPDQFDAPGTEYHHQPETAAVMEFCKKHYFVGSISFHGGDLVVNYPWDGNRQHVSGEYSASPDDDVFRAISLAYSSKHAQMYNSRDFPKGITNGAKWYVLYGGMQDWNYITRGTFEVTVELSYAKTPRASELQGYFDANKESMLSFLEILHSGVRGVVRKNGTPVSARISVDGIDQHSFSDPAQGDFYRPLTEGTYVLRASLDGEELTRTVYVPPMQPYSYTEVSFNFE